MVRGLAEAVKALDHLVRRGSYVDNSAFLWVLKRCIALKDLVLGSQVHALAVRHGCESNAYLVNQIICMYASFGRLEEATHVFSKVAAPNRYLWASIILAHARHGQPMEAINYYRQMCKSGAKPDSHVFVAVLKACATAKDLCCGKLVHADILRSADKLTTYVGNCLVDMYSKCGNLEDARLVFDSLPTKDVVTWNSMMAGYARQEVGQEALTLYASLQREGTIQPNHITFVCLLQACKSIGSVHQGKQLHSQIQESGLDTDVIVATCLVDMYLNCGSLDDAHSVFENLRAKDVVTWTAMIAGYAQHARGEEAIALYERMQLEGITPANHVTFIWLLQACASTGAIHQGKKLHSQIKEKGLQSDVAVGNCLVDMYAKCGSLEDARKVFDNLPARDVVTWNAMITGYTQHGLGQEALILYSSMQQEGMTPADAVTFICLLQACASVGALHRGKQLHAQIHERGLESDVVVGTCLVDMYAKCGSLQEAREVFDRLLGKNVVTWNAMLAGYVQHGHGHEAIALYEAQQREGIAPADAVTFVCLLQACVSTGALHKGKQIHAAINERGLKDDVAVCNGLVYMYAKCGSLQDARKVFDSLSVKDVGTWNAMIGGYAQHGLGQEALALYATMQHEGITPATPGTYVCLLQACASVGALQQGRQLHSQMEAARLELDAVVATCLINMYTRCRSLEDARKVFDSVSSRDVVTWNTMILGYAEHGHGQEALALYESMQREGHISADVVTFVCLLRACATIGALHKGKQLHLQIQERRLEANLVVSNCLVSMYAKCGSLADARSVFDSLPTRDVVTWNAMIAGYAQNGLCQEALTVYDSMQQEGITLPDAITFVCLLQACCSVAGLAKGKEIHAEISKVGLEETDLFVANSLVDMYVKCGSMVDARKVFDALPIRDIVTWNSLLSGYARQGESEIVFHLVERMRQGGIQPNDITFLSILTVCSHVGLVDTGNKYFEDMSTEYGISPTTEHYHCMIDLFGRAGQFDKVMKTLETMPCKRDSMVWKCVLGACRKWGNLELGREAFRQAVQLDENDPAVYLLMSNIYTAANMLEAAQEVQAMRLRTLAWKKPGQTWWTDSNGVMHSFLVADTKHPEKQHIHDSLTDLGSKMQQEVVVPHFASGISDDEEATRQWETL